MRSTSSVSESRTTRSTRSGSWYRQHGAGLFLMPSSIFCQMSNSPRRSRAKLVAREPSAEVRMIRPMLDGIGKRPSTFFSRSRSLSSSILRDTPLSRLPGIITR